MMIVYLFLLLHVMLVKCGDLTSSPTVHFSDPHIYGIQGNITFGNIVDSDDNSKVVSCGLDQKLIMGFHYNDDGVSSTLDIDQIKCGKPNGITLFDCHYITTDGYDFNSFDARLECPDDLFLSEIWLKTDIDHLYGGGIWDYGCCRLKYSSTNEFAILSNEVIKYDCFNDTTNWCDISENHYLKGIIRKGPCFDVDSCAYDSIKDIQGIILASVIPFSSNPSLSPSVSPTLRPTYNPTIPTNMPTHKPTESPIPLPTFSPIKSPTYSQATHFVLNMDIQICGKETHWFNSNIDKILQLFGFIVPVCTTDPNEVSCELKGINSDFVCVDNNSKGVTISIHIISNNGNYIDDIQHIASEIFIIRLDLNNALVKTFDDEDINIKSIETDIIHEIEIIPAQTKKDPFYEKLAVALPVSIVLVIIIGVLLYLGTFNKCYQYIKTYSNENNIISNKKESIGIDSNPSESDGIDLYRRNKTNFGEETESESNETSTYFETSEFY